MSWDGIERRKVPRMSKDSFTPSTAFEGYVQAKLENIDQRLNRLPCEGNVNRITTVENDLSNIKGKAAGIGALAGAAFSLILRIFVK